MCLGLAQPQPGCNLLCLLQDVITDACKSLGHDCIMCLGHNKGFEEAASSFAVSLLLGLLSMLCTCMHTRDICCAL